MPELIRSRPEIRGMSMNGGSGKMSLCPMASCLSLAWSATPPTSSNIRRVVADRIVRYAKVVGRDNVIAGTDCGFGGRIHPQIAWAKLEALAAGAKLATAELWK